MNSARVYKQKLQALENISRINIPTIISTTIAKNINEGEIKKIFKLCAGKPSQFYELRIRAAVPTGYHIDKEHYCLSDLMRLTCAELGYDYTNLKKEFDLIHTFNQFFKIRVMEKKTCSSFFHVRINNDGAHRSLPDILEEVDQKKLSKLFLWQSIIFPVLKNKIISYIKKSRPYALPGFVRISFRSWPTIYNIDLDEIVGKCTTSFIGEDKPECFCLTNIREAFKKALTKAGPEEHFSPFSLNRAEYTEFKIN